MLCALVVLAGAFGCVAEHDENLDGFDDPRAQQVDTVWHGASTLRMIGDNSRTRVYLNTRDDHPWCGANMTPDEAHEIADALEAGVTGPATEIEWSGVRRWGDYARVEVAHFPQPGPLDWVNTLYTSDGPGDSAAQFNPYFCRMSIYPRDAWLDIADQIRDIADFSVTP